MRKYFCLTILLSLTYSVFGQAAVGGGTSASNTIPTPGMSLPPKWIITTDGTNKVSKPPIPENFFDDFALSAGPEGTATYSLPPKYKEYSIAYCEVRPGNGAAYHMEVPTAVHIAGSQSIAITHSTIEDKKPLPIMRVACQLHD